MSILSLVLSHQETQFHIHFTHNFTRFQIQICINPHPHDMLKSYGDNDNFIISNDLSISRDGDGILGKQSISGNGIVGGWIREGFKKKFKKKVIRGGVSEGHLSLFFLV